MKTLPWKNILLLWLALAIITTSVPFVHWLRRPPGTVYTGYTYESVGDIFVYLNLIEQGKNGAVVFQDFFTSEKSQGGLFNPLFLVLGKTAAVFHLSPLVIWHIARVVLLFFFLFVLVKLVETLRLPSRTSWVAVLFVLCTGGVWLANSEAATFLSLLYSPMVTWSLTTTALVMLLLIRSPQKKPSIVTALLFILLGVLQAFIQPYVLILWLGLGSVFLAVEAFFFQRSLLNAVLTLAPLALGVILGYAGVTYEVMSSSVLSAWSHNAVVPPWAWYQVDLFFGALLPLALFGARKFRHRFIESSDRGIRMIFLWLLVAFVFSRSPYPYAYRLMLYVHLPLAVAAALGAVWLWDHTKKSYVARTALCFLFILAISDPLHHMQKNFTTKPGIPIFRYLQPEDVAATQWVRQHTPPDSVFLTAPAWDSLFATSAYRKVYVTEGWQTVDFMEKITQSLAVYAGHMSPDEFFHFLQQNGIRYVVLSAWERNAASIAAQHFAEPRNVLEYQFAFQPSAYPYLSLVYDHGTFQIYEVAERYK